MKIIVQEIIYFLDYKLIIKQLYNCLYFKKIGL